jgi:hypothetical protein
MTNDEEKQNSWLLTEIARLEKENAGLRETLCDKFAMSAISAIITGLGADISSLGLGAAKDAYNVAGHMMEARK